MLEPSHDPFIQQLQADPLATVCDYYAHRLADNPKAIEFLNRKSLYSQALAIGFSDRSLGNHIPQRQHKLGRVIRKQLEALGVYRDNGREHFRGMLTVPLHSLSGQVTGIYGRRVDMSNGGAVEQHIGQGIFNAAAVQQFAELIIAATVLDAWTFYAAGHTHVICPVDCQLSHDHLQHVQRVLLAGPDIDCSSFINCEIHRIAFPLDRTASSYAIAHQHTPDPLGKLIRAAVWQSGANSAQAAMQLTADQPAVEQQSAEQQSAAPADEPISEVTTAPTISTAEAESTIKPIAEPTTPTTEPTTAEPTAEPTDQSAAPQTPLASPAPAIADSLACVSNDTETSITIETRRWRIRGIERNTLPGVLRVNVMIFNTRNDRFHVDTFDLYHARSRRTFLAEAAEEIGDMEAQLRSDLGQVLLKVEELQHTQSQQRKPPAASPTPLTPDEQAAALELLRSENLLDRILDDFEACGIVGERTGKLVGYLAATSRLLDRPLGLVIQSSSAAGKSSLADAILRFIPQEDRFTCSAMTSQSLYYLGHENLKHKILAVAEEEGVRDASYQLKLLQSEGSLSLISTSKEKGSGRTSTERYTVEGPVALLLTTTASDVDPELMNRCLVVSVDESPTQTAAIHAQQRHARTLEGFTQKLQAAKLANLHQNAQRLLRPLRIYNPYAQQLGFIGSQTRYRRDHEKYLTLISTITLLHQHQRHIKTTQVDGHSYEYLEVTRHDIALANRVADWALGRSLDDLPGPTRRLLLEMNDWVRGQATQLQIQPTAFTFTRREAREALHWNATHLRNHIERLALHEYLIPQGRGQGKLHRYSLLYDGRGREGQPLLLGLVDAASLSEPAVAPTIANLAQQ